MSTTPNDHDPTTCPDCIAMRRPTPTASLVERLNAYANETMPDELTAGSWARWIDRTATGLLARDAILALEANLNAPAGDAKACAGEIEDWLRANERYTPTEKKFARLVEIVTSHFSLLSQPSRAAVLTSEDVNRLLTDMLAEYRREKPALTGSEIADQIIDGVMAALDQYTEDLRERFGKLYIAKAVLSPDRLTSAEQKKE